MSAITYYVALPFIKTEDGELIPGEGKECPSAFSAESQARLLARTPPICGAIAFSRAGDPNVGEFEDAKVLASVGEVLTIDQLLEDASM
jgi:hypothetical protein